MSLGRRRPLRRGRPAASSTGRDDEMIVSGGENVFPQEVEDCSPATRRSTRSPRSASTTRTTASGCKAFVVLERRRRASTRTTLKGYVKENLARYKVPREIVFLDELPRNATGKVLKRELATTRHRATGHDDPTGTRTTEPPDRRHRCEDVDRLHDGPEPRWTRPPTSPCATSSARTSRCRLPRAARRCALLLPLRLLRRVHRRDGRHPGPARRVPHLRHRGARDLVRPGLLPAGLRRPGRASTSRCSPTSGRTARWPGPTTSSTRSRARPRRSSYVIDKRGRSCAGRCTTPTPRGVTSTSTSPSCSGRWA